MSADPHRTTSGRDLLMDGLFGAGLALASGMTLRWMGAESAGTVVLALAAAPIGGALGYVLRATLASQGRRLVLIARDPLSGEGRTVERGG